MVTKKNTNIEVFIVIALNKTEFEDHMPYVSEHAT